MSTASPFTILMTSAATHLPLQWSLQRAFGHTHAQRTRSGGGGVDGVVRVGGRAAVRAMGHAVVRVVVRAVPGGGRPKQRQQQEQQRGLVRGECRWYPAWTVRGGGGHDDGRRGVRLVRRRSGYAPCRRTWQTRRMVLVGHAYAPPARRPVTTIAPRTACTPPLLWPGARPPRPCRPSPSSFVPPGHSPVPLSAVDSGRHKLTQWYSARKENGNAADVPMYVFKNPPVFTETKEIPWVRPELATRSPSRHKFLNVTAGMRFR